MPAWIAYLAVCGVAGSVYVAISGLHGRVPLLPVIAGSSVVVFLLVISRVAGIVRQYERAVAREHALGMANLSLVEAATPEAIATIALRTAGTLIDRAGAARLCAQRPGGLVLASAASRAETTLAPATIDRLETAAANPRATVQLPPAMRAELELPEGFTYAVVFPLAAREERRGLLIVASSTRLSPILVTAVDALCASVSLALESAALAEQAHRRDNEQRFASLVRNASDLITVVDRAGVVIYQSPSIQRILGLAPDGVRGLPFADLLAPADGERLSALLAATQDGAGRSQAFECLLIHSDGRPLKFEIVATDLCDDQHIGGIVLNGRDASERAAFERQLAHQSLHDSVTGLPNRAMFVSRVDRAIARAAGGVRRVAVVLIDLDDFKMINDSLGHVIGDEVLQQITLRLRADVRARDVTARFGGDEFAILLDGIDEAGTAVEIAQRLQVALERPIRVAGMEVVVRSSVGIALSGGDEFGPDDAGNLIRSADAALHTCKRDEKGSFRIFEPAMHEQVLELFELQGDLRRALDEQQFELHFQPLVRLHDGSAAGVEALVRWHHPTRGYVQPGAFIPLAEEMGLIVDLGRWVLREACRCGSRLRASGEVAPGFSIAVNLSVKQLQHPDIVADVRAALEDAGLPPRMLVLEITETVLVADYELASDRVQQLKSLGVRIAMDDFGTGYSSLGYLNRFAIDFLKMDRSFLSSRAGPNATSLAGVIVALGASLGLQVVAEGIEHREQYEALRDLGCDLGQGFLMGRPMDLAGLRLWLSGHSRMPVFGVTDELAA